MKNATNKLLAFGSRKRNLIILLVIEAILIANHNILQATNSSELPTSTRAWFQEAGWHFWPPLAVGLAIVAYALSLRCDNCGASQVFRGISAFDIRWPEYNCWKCDHEIEKKKS